MKFKRLGIEVFYYLAIVKYAPVTYEFECYSRIQLTNNAIYGTKWGCFVLYWTTDSIVSTLEHLAVFSVILLSVVLYLFAI